jgi:regulator of ribosome biosynthesis
MAATYIIDAGNLCITETSRVSGEQQSEEDLLASATRAAKQLFGELLNLPKVSKPGKPGEGHFHVTQLPVPLMRRPREKAPPKEKPLSAWEKFAIKKGISLNRKKQNKQWDEARQEWMDRWGKRAKEADRQGDWIREVPKNYTPGEPGSDPFLDDKRAKKEMLSKAKRNQERNERRATTTAKAQAEVARIDKTVSKLVTASMGKFDKSEAVAGKKKVKR